MLINSDLDSDEIPSISDHLIQPFSPSLSMSQHEKSSFSFGGLFEINRLISQLDPESSDLFINSKQSLVSNLQKSNSSSSKSLQTTKINKLDLKSDLAHDLKQFSQTNENKNPSQDEIYLKKVKELRDQIETLQNLYSKEVIEHESERKNFEENAKKLRNAVRVDPIKERFNNQQCRLAKLTELVESMNSYLSSYHFENTH